MYEEDRTVLDDVRELYEETEALFHEYNKHSVDLCRSFWPLGFAAADADLGACAALMEHLSTVKTLRVYVDKLLEILEAEDERAQARYRRQQPSSTGPASAHDAAVPRTSAREPSSEGCTQPESGQRKSTEF